MSEKGQPSPNKACSPAEEAASENAPLSDVQSSRERLGDHLDNISLLGDLNTNAETRELLQSLLQKCLLLFDCQSGSIFLLDKETGDLELAAAEGPKGKSLLGVRQRLGTGVAGTVAQTREGVFVEDIDQSDEFESRDSDRYETNSFASVPILHQGELLGVLSLCDKRSGQSFDAADVGRMLAISGFSAGSVHQAQQHDALRDFNVELHRQLDNAFAELQRTNQELARLTNFNESILASITMGVVAFDDNYRLTFHNPPARSILGIDPTGELDPALRNLSIVCDGLEWDGVLDAVVRDGRVIHCSNADYLPEREGLPPDRRVLDISVSPLRDGRGRISGGVVVAQDVTERVQMEKRLAASERHAVIGKLAARVAHELNNPLDGILRFINLSIALKDDDDPTREYLVESKKGLERMVGIVSSLLEFSRSTYPARAETSINEVIHDAAQTIRHRLDQQGIELIHDLDDGLPEMQCGELIQVFLNLIKNACDAMKDGGKLTFRSRMQDDTILVTVSDTGCGMPPDVVERAFDPFFTTKNTGEGTGLGLAICHDIVEKHGGSISVQTNQGEGTTFTITIPAS